MAKTALRKGKSTLTEIWLDGYHKGYMKGKEGKEGEKGFEGIEGPEEKHRSDTSGPPFDGAVDIPRRGQHRISTEEVVAPGNPKVKRIMLTSKLARQTGL